LSQQSPLICAFFATSRQRRKTALASAGGIHTLAAHAPPTVDGTALLSIDGLA